jgi:hypothetical protein
LVRTAYAIATLGLSALLFAHPAGAQNLIVQDGWQGFAVRSPDGKFDRCILYNRTVAALNASPYDMMGLSRDGAGQIGLIFFYQPRSLTRAAQQAVRLKLDQRAPLSLTGDVISDFHIVVPGPFSAEAVAALREARSVEATVENKTIRINVAGVGAALDRLADCVKTYAR